MAGLLVLGLVAVCAAVAWPHDSTLVPENGGRAYGAARWAIVFLCCEIAAFIIYCAGVYLLDLHRARLAHVAVIAAAVQLVPLGAPLLLSTDAWTYWDYGRIAAVHDANPYVKTPRAYPHDPAFRYAGREWRRSTTVYGPAFTLASEPLALADGRSPNAAAWTYKTIAAAASLGAATLAAFLARRKAFACAFVGWNPLLALHLAGGGHNDAWMAVLVMGALGVAVAGRRHWAGALWALAVLVKWIPLLFLPLRFLAARATGRRVGHLGFAAAAACLAAISTWQFGLHWLGAFGPLAANASKETSFALPHRLQQLGLPEWFSLASALTAYVMLYLWLLREARAGRARLGLAAGFLLLVTPYLWPWYLIWVVPLAAAEEDRPAQWLALGMSAYLLGQTIPF